MKHMLQSKHRRYMALGILAVVVLAAQGCAVRPITVDSVPQGATVSASGREIGKTPLVIIPDKVFPPRFVGSSYRAVGELKIVKDGCKPESRQVNDAVLATDIQVKLECVPMVMQPNEISAPPQAVGASGRAVEKRATPRAETVRRRLRTLEELRRDGLVAEAEYRKIRQRILNGI